MALIKVAPSDPAGHGSASANINAAGWISAMAAGASGKVVSMIGNAPALPSASTRAADDCSVTTTTGPNAAMMTRNLQRVSKSARYAVAVNVRLASGVRQYLDRGEWACLGRRAGGAGSEGPLVH